MGKKKQNDLKMFLKRQYVFVLGVYFWMGIVVGAFIALSAIEICLGFPIPFRPILWIVTANLMLCYCMIWCFDRGRTDKKHKQKHKHKQNQLNGEQPPQKIRCSA